MGKEPLPICFINFNLISIRLYRALLWNFPVMLFVSLLLMLAGLVIYAVNADCDIGVYGLGLVTRNDQVGYF